MTSMTTAQRPLRRINWTTGMLLTPEHMLEQDAAQAELAAWALRFSSAATGLVGGGPRVPRQLHRIQALDPVVSAPHDDGFAIHATVHSVHGITPAGQIVSVGADEPLSAEVRRDALFGRDVLYLAVTGGGESEADPRSFGIDTVNPEQFAYRVARHTLTLSPRADEIENSLIVARFRRTDKDTFALDDQFIPPCATMLAHSALFVEWTALRAALAHLADRCADVHRRIGRYVALLDQAGAPSRLDRDVQAFIERLAIAIDSCAYELLDPGVAPERAFRQIELAGRRAAIGLDLIGNAKEFLRLAPETDPALERFLEEERDALATLDAPAPDVRTAADRARTTLARISRLVELIREKYDDFRDSCVLGRLSFLLDEERRQVFARQQQVLYAGDTGPVRRFQFTDLASLPPGEYRLVLLAHPDTISDWSAGDKFALNAVVIPAEGTNRAIPETITCHRPAQRNFALDLPSTTTTGMTAIRVEVNGRAEWFESAALYRLVDGREHRPAPPEPQPQRNRAPDPPPEGNVIKVSMRN